MTYVHEPPFSIQVELTEGCNLRCPFCGLNGIRTPKDMSKKLLTVAVAERIASEIAKAKWNCRIEFAMHGEPTLNPDAEMVIAAFRRALPRNKMMMLSNGGGIVGKFERIHGLLDAGLNTLAFDEYQGVSLAQKIREALELTVENGVTYAHVHESGYDGVPFYEYPRDGAYGNPHKRVDWQRLIIVAPIDLATDGTHNKSRLINHAGSGGEYASVQKRCAKPFREMAFRWDGHVALCCNDWRGEFVIGDIDTMSIEDIWHHPRFEAARRRLILGQRDFDPCKKCDNVSYRLGLLPDKKGQATLPPPQPGDDALIEDAHRDGPLTPPVLRPWEKPQ